MVYSLPDVNFLEAVVLNPRIHVAVSGFCVSTHDCKIGASVIMGIVELAPSPIDPSPSIGLLVICPEGSDLNSIVPGHQYSPLLRVHLLNQGRIRPSPNRRSASS